MKRILFILLTIMACSQSPVADSRLPYIDDSYYWPIVDTISPVEPVYDRNAREFIFLEDTTQHPDTVVMVIKN